MFKDKPTEKQFMELMLNLSTRGIKAINVYYEGSGDSGAIDSVTATIDESKAQSWIEDPENAYHYSNDGDIVPLTELEHQIIQDMSYEYILNNIGDWYNNDGGFGNITIEVPSGKYNCSNNMRITQVETESVEGNFLENLAKKD